MLLSQVMEHFDVDTKIESVTDLVTEALVIG